MKNEEFQALGFGFLSILLLIFYGFGIFNMGAFYARKEAKNETTIECIETPEKCKDRYEYIKLGEKLAENQK